jgi:geranylgeranyl diphosphate synthase type II
MFSLKDILLRIEREVSGLCFDHSPAGLYDPIKYVLSLGGKRIRPALALIACNIYKDDIDDAILPALSLEVFHNFTLLHDDLMDEADMRRNQPAVHKKWNRNTAILSGDAMLIVAYQLISQSKPEYLKKLLGLFTSTALQICEGQQFDMEFESRCDVDEAEYIEMIQLKTAVLLACGLKMGAMLGGGAEEDVEHLYQYGLNIGLAFQLKDDLLDVYGSPATFGKNIGGDILCNKKTFLLISALKNGSKEQREALIHWMGEKTFDASEKINIFRSIYDVLRIQERTEKKIHSFYMKALSHLDKLKAPKGRLLVLEEVCNRLLYRKS